MIIYLLVFIVSLYFTKVANQYSRQYILHLLAFILPVILLTYRDVSVGTDTSHYYDIYSTCASFNSLFDYLVSTRLEVGFASVTFFLSKFNVSIYGVFFTYAILTVLPVYLGAVKLKENVSPTFVMALYYLMFYQYSFNIVRQSIAMSFVFLSAVMLFKKNTRMTFFYWIVAILFHNTSFVFLVYLLLYLFMFKRKAKILFICSIVIFGLYYIAQNYYADSIVYYVAAYTDKGTSSQQSSYLVEMILNTFLTFRAKLLHVKNGDYFFYISIITLSLIVISPIIPFLFRLANFYDILLLIYIPSLLSKHIFGKSAYLFFGLFFWWFCFILNNSGESNKYSSIILGIN